VTSQLEVHSVSVNQPEHMDHSGSGRYIGTTVKCLDNIMMSLPDPSEYQKHVDLWRASNPGLFGYDKTMFHTHQAYAVED
jgi:hypothetical protein